MIFKNVFVALTMAVASLGMLGTTMDAEAKRLGGGRPAGMQRQMPPKQPAATPNQAAPKQNAPANAAAPAQAGKRNWMGPIAGIAAGLGIAALMSHLGMGEAFGNFMTMALLAMVAIFAIRWLMQRFSNGAQGAGAGTRGLQMAGAGAPYPHQNPMNAPMQRQAFDAHEVPAAASSASQASALPAGFDAVGFERIAKMIFIRLQAANDEANVEDIRKFTTPELFASLRLDLQERGNTTQQTDVMQLDAVLVDAQQEAMQWVASVQFSGLIREEADAGALPFKELWHLVKPIDDSREWAIAGITPLDA
jgi:predicted lipid-binding transport protein (Tim44 family)